MSIGSVEELLTLSMLFDIFTYMRIFPNIPRPRLDPENIDLSLTTLLGRGRHGSVFLGQLDGHPVAVKIPAKNDRHSAERHALARFDHPNIVSLIREPLPNGALVLEHLGGGSLADLLSTRAQVSVGETADLIRPICDALRHIHEHGWIHGDIAPSNIAFRDDRTPVLIDFATARPADQGELSEGNPDFVGPLREAATAVDVRSLAATALRALGIENRWEPDPTRVRSTLAALIERADTGQPVSVDELDDIFAAAMRGAENESASLSAVQPTLDPLTPHRLGIGSTRSFGPRPSSGDVSETRRTSRPRLVAACVVLVAALLIGYETQAASVGGRHVPADETVTARRVINSDETLEKAQVLWDSSTGILTRTLSGSTTSWRVGASGDLAAVADWNCDGEATLGVYRPSSGSWFVFSSWDHDATSSPPIDIGRSPTLSVEHNAGCARAFATLGNL